MKTRIGAREKIGYGLGDMASNFVWTSAMSYLAFFYTDIFGISAAAVGVLMLLARLWDAVNDPIMGMIAERTRSRHGVFRPYLLWMAIPFGVAAVLTFTTPNFGIAGKLVWAYATYISLGMAYTAINMPYSAMTATMTQDPDERVSLSTYRMTFAFLGGLIVNILTLPLIKALGGANQKLGYQLTMGIFGAIATVMYFVCFATTRERVMPADGEAMPIKDSFKAIEGNTPWFLMIGMAFLGQAVNTMKSGVTIYFFTYNLGKQELIPLFMMAIMLPMLVAMPIGNMASRKLDKKGVIMLGSAIAIVFNALFFILNPQDTGIIILLTVLGGLGTGMTIPASFALGADTVEYGEWKSGVRAAGFLTAGGFFGGKLGTSIGGALLGFILAGTGYIAGGKQGASTLFAFRFMISGLPAIAGVANIVILTFWKLDRATFHRLMVDLEERKNAKTAEAV
ncbi:MAG: MFS transporter [Spirochaetes bacterium]|nr:MFS transporter [Spirochaetota bacterium]MBU1081197.1 MFS transporter [Spirochaetota bacterium]